ncbi:MAG: hypothetical protein VYE22_41325 [Myxococcota bacterium]|nr:hypothetical protein [Myxococcota bacterium]
MIHLPVDPTDEELARDWTLGEEDLVEVRRAEAPTSATASRFNSACCVASVAS